MLTLGHLLYIPLTLAIGIYIGHRMGREAERQDRKKRQKLRKTREKRQKNARQQ